MREEHRDEIYRPGEDVSHLVDLDEDQKTDRRREIEAIFNNPDAYIVGDDK